MSDDREPPPLFAEEEEATKDADSDELFPPTSEIKDRNDNQEDKTQAKENEEEPEDLFSDSATTEVPLDSPEDAAVPSAPPSVGVTVISPASLPTSSSDTAIHLPSNKQTVTTNGMSNDEVEELERGDRFSMEITVTDPVKRGDGMSSFMAYRINTKTTIPQYLKSEMAVYRRFSDFLGIHDKLTEKHSGRGHIVPPAPEKSVIGMTKIKMSKEEASSVDFIEKRRAALERFLNRVAKHPVLRVDADFQEFLEAETELPRSTSTSALSGAGVMRLFNKVGDSLNRATFKMNESDQWFEEKQDQIEGLDDQLRKLHTSIESLVQHRKDLALNTGTFAKSVAMLGNAEEHTSLSRALAQLSEVEEKIDQVHMDQADADFFVFSELIKDYIALIGAVKDVFQERVKIFKAWKDAETNLAKKREAKAKLELARKMDKIPAVAQEISELEDKVEKYQEDFETISKTIKKEMEYFDKQRIKDFKNTVINYLEALMNSQQQVIKYWESFLPEAKAIA